MAVDPAARVAGVVADTAAASNGAAVVRALVDEEAFLNLLTLEVVLGTIWVGAIDGMRHRSAKRAEVN